MRAAILSIFVLSILLWIVTSIADIPFAPVAGNLVFGWLTFLGRVGRRVTVNWNGMLTAAVCLALFYIGLHVFLRWLVAAMQAHGDMPSQSLRTWRWRWTSAIVGVLVLMFVAGLAFIGIVHQTTWLATAKQPLLEERADPNRLSPSKDQFRMISMGVGNYLDAYKALPPYGRDRQKGRHSWLTAIMPFTMLYVENIDYKLDWNHPKNAPAFQRIVPLYLNPEIAPFRNAEGYALSHYAGNVQLFGNDKIKSFSDIKNGSSNTVLVGEVVSDFKAWGDPSNLRDPSTGFNNRPDGFGGPSGDGGLALMVDGSVKFFGKDTSARVLSEFRSRHAPP